MVGMQAGAATVEDIMDVPPEGEDRAALQPHSRTMGIYPEITGILIERETCTLMFIAALSTTAEVWKQSKCPRMDEGVRKMGHI